MKIDKEKLQNREHDFTYDLAEDSFLTGLDLLRKKCTERDITFCVPACSENEANMILKNYYGDIGGTFPPYIYSKIKIRVIKNPISPLAWYLVTKDAVIKSLGDNG